MLEQWVKTILAPIDCIIDSILLQLSKLENLGEEMQFTTLPHQYKKVEMTYSGKYGNKMYFYYPDPTPENFMVDLGKGLEKAMEAAKEPLQQLENTIHKSFSELLIIFYKGRDSLLAKWNEVRDWLMELLGLDLDAYSLMAELSTMI